jgi:YD repeat-containing protein
MYIAKRLFITTGLFLLFVSFIPSLTLADEARFFYDELGRLVRVIDGNGNVATWTYDEVGNILEVKRSIVTGLAIFDFTPRKGTGGTIVAIQGQGFRTNPVENIIQFNGVGAAITRATTKELIVQVPSGATTGPIQVTVDDFTATSERNFIVSADPVITSMSHRNALSGVTIAALRVTGERLTGSTFSFFPENTPTNGLLVDSVAIDPRGTTASLVVTVGPGARGPFVLVATNPHGQSDRISSARNTLTIFDFGTAPLSGEAGGITFSALNSHIPVERLPTSETGGKMFSILNQRDPSQSPPIDEAGGPMFSIENSISP